MRFKFFRYFILEFFFLYKIFDTPNFFKYYKLEINYVVEFSKCTVLLIFLIGPGPQDYTSVSVQIDCTKTPTSIKVINYYGIMPKQTPVF